MRINYTTYDVRRSQDTINPRTDHCDIMLLAASVRDSNDTNTTGSLHQYRYARVVGIYHVNVIYGGRPADYRPRRMEFLWVRWFKVIHDVPPQQGWSTGQLDQLRFPSLSEDAFGFVDPSQVLRACHIVQRFTLGKISDPGRLSLSERSRYKVDDWNVYYANR